MRPLRFLRPAHSPVAVVHAMSRLIEERTIFDVRAEEVFHAAHGSNRPGRGVRIPHGDGHPHPMREMRIA